MSFLKSRNSFGFFICFALIMTHKAGFVNIIGRPNVGKSTLMNALVGERLSIVTPKAQTTRQRLIGILSDDDFQIVFSDTPGIIFDPVNTLHKAMLRIISGALADADVLLFMTDFSENADSVRPALEKLKNAKAPKILVLNKIDAEADEKINEKLEEWKEEKIFDQVIAVSALQKKNLNTLVKSILDFLPEHEEYYPKDMITDRTTRYLVSEIIREKIFLNYRQEIPYSAEVIIVDYSEAEDIDKIRAEIFVERDSQKGIMIGEKGRSLKKVGIESRKEIEKLVGKKVYLELHVKVKEKWRDNTGLLRNLGFET